MAELLLFRHAKSRRDEAGVRDHDRDLAPRGERDAPRMGRLIASEGLIPDLVFCSTAKRARRTWELAAAALPAAPEAVLLRELYLASPEVMAALVRARAGAARRVMLVGHNPGLHEFATSLAGAGDPGLRARLAEKFPTGGLAQLALGGRGWKALGAGPGRLVNFWRPREVS